MPTPRVTPGRSAPAASGASSGDTSLVRRYVLALVLQVIVVAGLVWLSRHFS